MNRKGGLFGGLVAFIAVLFFFSIFALIGSQAWYEVNQEFQNLDNETAPDYVKEDINELTKFMTYMDTAFVFLFVAMIISYLVVAGLSSTEKPFFLLIFMGFLIILTLVAMTFSNTWKYTLTVTDWDVLEDYKLTDWIMSFLPVITFLTGIIGAIIYFSRKNGGVRGGGDQFAS